MADENYSNADYGTIAILLAFQIVIPQAIKFFSKSIDNIAKYFNLGNDSHNTEINDVSAKNSTDKSIEIIPSNNISDAILVNEVTNFYTIMD